jgi:hypothetical protein
VSIAGKTLRLMKHRSTNEEKSQEGKLMIICEFCLQYRESGECSIGLSIRKGMRCHEFDPGLVKFCANLNDFKGTSQIIQMATYFGLKGMELKKVRQVAAQEEEFRHKASPAS